MDYHITSQIPKQMNSAILEMIHQSFDEHLKNGLHFTCYDYSLKDLEEKVLSGFPLVAVANDGTILGITSFSLLENGGAYENITAISPKSKGMGIGTALFQKRQQMMLGMGVKYVLSDTAVNAKSSVNWHVKKCGCHIVGLSSFPSTNYYSYIFRQDLVKRSFWVRKVIYPLQFISSSIMTKVCKKENGSFTWFGGYLAKLLKKSL